MALNFVTGSSGSGKSFRLLSRIIHESIEHPQQKFFVIVPEQFTMQTQKELVRLHPRHGILNIDVLSFDRLAFRVFEETGYRKAELLEEIGKSFVLEKIALREKKNLPFFGQNLTKPGNLAEMKSIISELLQYNISENQLLPFYQKSGEHNPSGAQEETSVSSGLLQLKLHDIGLIYHEFMSYLAARYMTAEEVPDVLSRLVPKSGMLRGSYIVLDGFTGFTPVQLTLVRSFLSLAAEVYITVTMDAGEDPFSLYKDTDLFAMSHETVLSVTALAEEDKIPVRPPVRVGEENAASARFAASPPLSFLEHNIFRQRGEVYSGGNEDIRIFAAVNPLKEIEETARTICRMVREEGLRYRDFAVITGDLTQYGSYVRQVFGMTGIPYFIDEKRYLLHNPFVEYLRAAVEACTEDYSYDSIFRMLRSGMSGIPAEDTDRLENYVLALGIRGKKRWRAKWVLTCKTIDPKEVPVIDETGKKVCALLDPLADAFSVRGGTIKEKTEALLAFCERSACEEKLLSFAGEMEMVRPDLARENTQVYARVTGFLAKLVDVLGDEPVSMKDYRAILEAGFSEEKIGIIPPGTDEVLIGDIERSRLSDIRVLFFVGVNEGLVPKVDGGGGILSETDRDILRAGGVRLKPTLRESVSIGRFYLYLALTKPSRSLILSYSLSNSAGETMRPAYLIGTITDLFPDIHPEKEKEELSCLAERPENSFSLLTDGLVRIREKTPSPAWMELFSWYRKNPDYAHKTDALLTAAGMRRPQDEISRKAARELYGAELVNSATRLERFSECQFAHFLQYGLRLKEREEYSFTGMDMGNVIHSALWLFAEKLRERNLDWGALDDAARDRLAGECVAEASGNYGAMVLHDSARNEYAITRMQRLMTTSVWAIGEQLKAGDFLPSRFEADFRNSDELSSVHVDLPDGAHMALTGRIDRIDTFTADGKTYVKIIDYKTGSMGFDMTAVYYGLQLQLVVYLNAAVEIFGKEGQNVLPAGIFYYEIKDPVENFVNGETDDELKERILSDMRSSGLVSGNMEILSRLDRSLSPEHPKSAVLPVSLKKDGTLSALSKTADEEEFRLISSFVNKKIREIGEKIMAGRAEVNPYQYKTKTACDFCPYCGICHFDRRIPGYGFRNLLTMKDDEVLEAMKKEEE